MNKSIFELLSKYNKETNNKMNEIIKTLREEDWDKQFSGYYKSIHELCSHIFIGDYTWLNRFRTLGTWKSLGEHYFNKNYSFKEIVFENISEYCTKRTEMDSIIVDFTDEITENDLEKTLEWTNSKGIHFERKLATCLIHLSHHESHHRGMISLYLEFLGKENDYSNLYPYGQ